MGGSGFAVVSTAREFSQIRLIAALIITMAVCWDWKSYAITHTNQDEEKVMLPFDYFLTFYILCNNYLPFPHTQVSSLHLSKAPPNMSYSAPLWVQWEVPGPTSPHTISPKACPTPTIVPHSTQTHNGHSRARGPTMQFHHTKPQPGLIPSEREKNDRGDRRSPILGVGQRKTCEKQSAVCLAGVADNILRGERHTVGKLLLSVCDLITNC